MKRIIPARIHLLPAKDVPRVVVLRRKPSKMCHVMLWDTERDELVSGSWFKGRIYHDRSDVSSDGKWMICLAMDAMGETWNGVCKPPSMKTHYVCSNMGTYGGGGCWRDAKTLMVNWVSSGDEEIPFQIETMDVASNGDLGVLIPRLERDGWTRCGSSYGEDVVRTNAKRHTVDRFGDDGWMFRPTPEHPTLRTQYVGYLEHGYTFRFWIEEMPGILDEHVEWACWDALGSLVFARQGVLVKYTLEDLLRGSITTAFDLEPLVPGQQWGSDGLD